LRAGPSWRKPLADLALLGCFAREARRERFDVVLAHNAEAGVVGLAARSLLHIPVVYVAHTLLRYELSAYAPRALAPWSDALGARLDAALAGNANAVIALCCEAEARLAAATRCPVVRIPPALGVDEPPVAEQVAKTCALHGLSAGGFVLYAGNLDAYQDLDDLVHVAARIEPTPVVVATHERRRAAPAPVRTLRIDDVATLRLLTHGAALCVVARRRPGGFPVKLLNYLEAARAVVAHARVGDGLTHDRNAWLLPPGSSADAIADAVADLLRDPIRCARLGAAGRAHLMAQHDPAARATEVLALIERVLR
jgi:glycosyltransferase involved in cell wall biosynthesis